MVWTPPSASTTSRSRRYSGRKSWPHCETQCASSMARQPIATRLQRRRARRRAAAAPARCRAAAASGRAGRARSRRRSSGSDDELRLAAATPSSRSCATWSRISAISGETTSVRPSRTIGGSWKQQRLAAAGRHHREHVLAGERRRRGSPPGRGGRRRSRRRWRAPRGPCPSAAASSLIGSAPGSNTGVHCTASTLLGAGRQHDEPVEAERRAARVRHVRRARPGNPRRSERTSP